MLGRTLLCLALLAGAAAFQRALLKRGPFGARLSVNPVDSCASTAPVTRIIPEEISMLEPLYNMVLLERIPKPESSKGGIFLPRSDGGDQMHLAVILSLPKGDVVSPSGTTVPIANAVPVQVGDTVFVRDAWGIGPGDIQVGQRFFSFQRAAHVTAVTKSVC